MASTPQFVNIARTAFTKFINTDGTVAKTLLTMGPSGGLIEGLFVTSTDTAAHDLTLRLSDGIDSVVIDTVTIPAAIAGMPVQQVNLLDVSRWRWLDSGNVKWVLAAGTVITAQMVTAVSLGYEVAVVANYGEF